MENVKCKFQFCFVCLIFLLSFFFTSCESGVADDLFAAKYSGHIDDTDNSTDFPQYVSLDFGESVLIESAHTLIRFIDVLDFSGNNSAVCLEVEYENGEAFSIVLNTNNSPQYYDFGNGYDIHLTSVYYLDYTFHIMFVINRYGYA